MPPGIAFTVGELQNFDGVLIGVFEVESFDATRIPVPIGQALRAGGGVLDFVLPQNRIGAVHIANDNGDVLEPNVIAPGIYGNRATLRSQKLQQLDGFAAELHGDNSNARAEYAEEVLDVVSGYL